MDMNSMHDLITHLPQHIYNGYHDVAVPAQEAKVDKVVVCGMGGSGIAGHIIAGAYGKKMPVRVVSDYDLGFIDAQTLVVVVSYSGNTEETLACYELAQKQTKNIAGVTTGGKLGELLEGRFPLVRLQAGFPPRAAVAFLFGAVHKILEAYGLVASIDAEISAATSQLAGKVEAVFAESALEQNLAKQIAQKLKGKIAVIYASEPVYSCAAYRMKCQINENANTPAFWHYFPEMNHNEIEGYYHQDLPIMPVFLLDFDLDARYQKRINVFSELIDEKIEIYAEGKSYIEKVFSLIFIGDMVSYYLALENGVDPFAIENIMFLKKNL